MTKKAFLVILAILAVTLPVTGCGSDDEGSATAQGTTADKEAGEDQGAGSLTKAEYIQKAEEICLATKEQVALEYREYIASDPRAGSRSARFIEVADTILLPGIQELIDNLEAIGGPAGEEEFAEELVRAMQEGLDESKRSKASRAATVNGESPLAEADKLAADYGMTVCSEL